MQPLNVIWLLFIFLSGISVQRYTFIPSIKEDGCKTIKVNGFYHFSLNGFLKTVSAIRLELPQF